jgi:uncharacterized protein YecT (DUF1311 family)
MRRGLAMLAAAAALNAAAAASDEGALPDIEGCGRALPAALANPVEARQFGSDPAAFRDGDGRRLAREIAALCRFSPPHRALIAERVAGVRFVTAQGAGEPRPYVGGSLLVVEFAGGGFDRARFRRDLAAALERGNVVTPSFDCAKAASPAEQAICTEPDLAAADAALGDLYRQAMAARRGDPAAAGALRREQRAWRAARDQSCGGAVECLKAALASRSAALVPAAEASAADAPAPAPVGILYRNRRGQVELTPLAGGNARFAIATTSPQGACGLPDPSDDDTAWRIEGGYVFRSADGDCTVTLTVTQDRVVVGAAGQCTQYCGVHAPGFTGTYRRGD